MKTRNGFVSNSSSSSFVVAFPKQPKTGADVWTYMFGGKEGGISVYDNEGLSHSQISGILFSDLESQNFKKATINDIIEEFSGRYHYYPNGNHVFWLGKTVDDTGGSWLEPVGRYYGSNAKILEQLRIAIIDSENNSKALREEELAIENKSGPKKPKKEYAYKNGIDPDTKLPYTDRDIKAKENYYKALGKFKKTNKEYIAFDKKRMESWHNKHDLIRELSDKLAKEDAKNFLDDNKGKYIFIISYADEDGSTGSTMEHGGIFKNVPHVRISKH